MAPSSDTDARRAPLTRDRVLRAAVALADADGIGGVTIRSLADALGVKPMAVYHHVANKEAILDGAVDLVFAEIDQPDGASDWRTELLRRGHSMRDVLRRHPWAVGLMESRRSPGPATLRHHDAMIGLLRTAGFAMADVAHANAFFDAYLYGFAVQEAALPFEGTDEVHELASEVMAAMPVDEYPNFVAFAVEHVLQPGYDFADEFDVGLDLVIDAIGRLPSAPRDAAGSLLDPA
ncbi:MAG: TetR/AcrR family transcriptional regulator [Acidimicrobiales bacterium]